MIRFPNAWAGRLRELYPHGAEHLIDANNALGALALLENDLDREENPERREQMTELITFIKSTQR